MSRMLLGRLARGALAAVALSALSLAAQAQTVLTFGGSDAVGSLLDRANTRFAELVNERAGGELKVNFISGEQLGSDLDVIQQLMQGSVQLYGDVLDWYANWIPDLNILNWGFTFDSNDHLQRFLDSDLYAELIEKLRLDEGIRVLAAAPTQPRILFASRPVNAPADLDGLKMRVPEIKTYLLLWETLGTRPSRLAWAEVYLGLSTGTIEAAEGPVSAAYAQKFHQAATNVIRTDHLVSSYHITMNDAAYQALSPAQQQLLADTAREVTAWARAQAEAETEGVVQKMAAEGATIITVDKAPFQAKAVAGVDAMEKDGVWSEGLWERIRALD